MKIAKEQYEKIEKYLPKQRGNIKINGIQFLKHALDEAKAAFSIEFLSPCKQKE